MSSSPDEALAAWLRAEAERDHSRVVVEQVLDALPPRGRWSVWALCVAGLLVAARATATLLVFLTS